MVEFDEARQRYRIKISETVDGKRIRKTKLLPAGISYERACEYAAHTCSAELTFREILTLAVVNRKPFPGYVYAVRNPRLPGLIKIGMTQGAVRQRVANLSTGHPEPWHIVCSARVGHVDTVEAQLHRFLANHRETQNREFFRIPDDLAIAALTVCEEVDGASARLSGEPIQ